VLTTLYFAIWFGLLMLVKRLMLEQYHVEFRGLSLALLGALIVAKVVLILEHVSLGSWIHNHPKAVNVILRTLLYTFGVFIALLLEKAIEARHEYGGVGAALAHIFHHRDIPHVWANTICVGSALLFFNTLTTLREHFGDAALMSLFFAAPSGEVV
jgi:hypothetical protein